MQFLGAAGVAWWAADRHLQRWQACSSRSGHNLNVTRCSPVVLP